MGFGLIFTGLMFFLNFNIGIVDLLPDFIGCFFIMGGLRRLRDIDERFAYAFRVTGYMAAFSALKLVISFVQRNYTLPFTFIASVVETILLFAFFNSLFGAIEYTAERHNGLFMTKTVTIKTIDKATNMPKVVQKNIDISSRAAIMAYVFVLARGVLSFLPEAVELIGHRDTLDLSYNAVQFSAALAKPPVMLLCYTLIIIAGICFIAITGKYLLSIRKDTSYIESCLGFYKENILTDKKLLCERSIASGFMFIFVSIVFLLDPIVEHINLFPDALAFATLVIAYYIFAGQTQSRKALVTCLGAVGGVFSILSCYLYAVCNSHIKYRGTVEVVHVPTIVESGHAVWILLALSAIEAVVLCCIAFLILKCITRLPFSKELDGVGFNLTFTGVSLFSFAVLSVLNTVAPLYKAYAAINTNHIISDFNDYAHLVVVFAMYVALILTANGFYKLKSQISLYI